MKFTRLDCAADLIGQRVRVAWAYRLDPGEAAGSLPDVTLRRKFRDFDFPPLSVPDPYLVYDSATFPPAPVPGMLAVTDLPRREQFEGGVRVVRSGISLARLDAGQADEILREIREERYDAQGQLAELRTELVDAAGLPPQKTLYYELDDGSAPSGEEIARYRATAVPGALHGHNRDLWDLVPEVYRSADTVRLAEVARIHGLSETRGTGGQLRRFLDMFGLGFDHLRNSAEALALLRDIDQAPPQFLDLLGKGIGWQPAETVPLGRRRNEVRNATRLYALNGTPQSLRTLVTQQTGWRSQVAELADNVARANVAASGNLYFTRAPASGAGAGWRGGLDCAAAFGFPPAPATGSATGPAILEGAASEPFGLKAGEELTVSVDGDVPVRIRFARADFVDIAAATAAEVAGVINRLLDNVVASNQGGRLRLTTRSTGLAASLTVLIERQSLLALSDLPLGAIATTENSAGGIDLFFRDEQRLVSDGSGVAHRGAYRANRIVQKSWGHGLWRDAAALPRWTADAEDLDACTTADGASLLIWSSRSGLSLARGAARPGLPASFATRKRQPFALSGGMRLAVATAAGTEIFTVSAADYADVANATAIEIAAAMNAQFANLAAAPQIDGSLRLTSIARGSRALLRVDLAQSTAAHALGLDARELLGRGHWSPARDWQGPLAGPTCWGPAADPAVVAHPVAGVLAVWAEHDAGAWQIRSAHESARLLLATAGGVAERADASSPWIVTATADGLPSDVVRMTLLDAEGSHWFATDSGLARRRLDGSWQTFTTGDGLASNDIRAIALLPTGVVACATPAGLSELTPGSGVANTPASPAAMVSGDLHAVASGAGALWVGSSNGIGRRGADGNWTWWDSARGVPAVPITALALAPGRPPAAGSAAAGVLLLREEATWSAHPMVEGGPPTPVRAILWHPDGSLLAATATGLARYRDRGWSLASTFTGLPGNDLTAIGLQSDGSLLLGTPAGLLVENPGSGWSLLGSTDGLPGLPVTHVSRGWSAPRILAASPGGDREPHLAVEAGGEIWLAWSRRINPVPASRDDWGLRLSRLQSGTSWSAPQPLTAPPPGGAADRRPRMLAVAGGGVRIALTTGRTGAAQTALLDVDAAGTPGLLSLFPPDSARATNPTLAAGPDGETWMFHRGDAPLVPSQLVLAETEEHPASPSLLVPDAATIRQQAGALTPLMAHAARHGMRGRFGDPQTYTEMRPDARADDPALPVPFYTERTIAVYMRQSPFGKAVTSEEIARLFQLLNRFKPLNLRVALVIAPDPHVEFLYPPGADILESWLDNVPLAEVLGPIGDSSEVVIPGLAVLHANELASRSARASAPATLLRRTWFPDLQ